MRKILFLISFLLIPINVIGQSTPVSYNVGLCAGTAACQTPTAITNIPVTILTCNQPIGQSFITLTINTPPPWLFTVDDINNVGKECISTDVHTQIVNAAATLPIGTYTFVSQSVNAVNITSAWELVSSPSFIMPAPPPAVPLNPRLVH